MTSFWAFMLLCFAGNEMQGLTGKVRFELLLFDPVSKDFTTPVLPPSELWVHNQYVIEVNRIHKETVVGNQVEKDSYPVQGYFFIDTDKNICVEYDQLSVNGQKKKSYPLGEKKNGYRFYNAEDLFKNALSKIKISDSVINNTFYKKFTLITDGPSTMITAYLDTTITTLPLYMSKTIRDKYKGHIARMDIEDLALYAKMSYRMSFEKMALPDSVAAVIQKWALY